MWSDEQVLDALRAGAEADSQPDTEPQQATPDPAPADTPEGNDPQPEAEGQPEPASQDPDLFEGTQINPDDLPEELQPLAKQLQAAFTQKTQEVASRRRELEALGSLEELQQALQFNQRVLDPNNWVQLHQELTQAMEAQGMTPAQAHQAATDAIAQEPAPAAPSLSEIDDPELAPLVEHLNNLQARIDAMNADREAERQNAIAEQQYLAQLAETQRAHNVIQDQHKDWDEDKMLMVYEIASFHNGDLFKGAERLEKMLAAERSAYVASKSGVTEETGTRVPPRGAGTQTQTVNQPETILDAEEAAIEFFKQRMADYAG